MNEEKWAWGKNENKDLNISNEEKEATKKAVDEHFGVREDELIKEIVNLENEINRLRKDKTNCDNDVDYRKITQDLEFKIKESESKIRELKEIQNYFKTKKQEADDITPIEENPNQTIFVRN